MKVGILLSGCGVYDGSEIQETVAAMIALEEKGIELVTLLNIGKPIVAVCVSPILLSLALKDSRFSPTLSLGTSKEKSPYDISAFHEGIAKNGGKSTEKGINEISIDLENKIICAPCYMQDASLLEIKNNATIAIEKLIEFID